MPWPFKRTRSDAMSVDTLLADANVASPGGFQMTVEDVFSISRRGTVVTGTVAAGAVSVGQQVSLLRGGAVVRTVKVTGIEEFRKTLDAASAGQNVGLLLDAVSREDVARGDVLSSS